MNKTNIKRLQLMFDHHDGVSQRQAARKFKCTQQMICKTLKTKAKIVCFNKKRYQCERRLNEIEFVPAAIDYIENFKVFRASSMTSLILLWHTVQSTAMTIFTPATSQKLPPVLNIDRLLNLSKKFSSGYVLSDKGVSQAYFVPSGLAINQNIYLEQCIKKRLVPFIEKHHSDGKYLFWPDLASAHYAKTVISYFNEKRVNYVTKCDNPPNVPELRPIEDFWGILKGLVYANNWQATDPNELRNRINNCIKKIDIELVKATFKSTRLRIGRVRTNGLIEDN